jgi:hypothetical protein
VTYRFESTLAQVNDVQIGTQAATMVSLKNAINGTGTAGTDYYAGTTKNLLAGVTSSDTNNLYLTARMGGTDGNLIQLSRTSSRITVSGTTLAGGSLTVDGQSEPINFGYQASFINDPAKVFVNQM